MKRLLAAGVLTAFVAGDAGADLGAVGDEFQVNTHTTDAQYEPAIAALPDNEFVVVWSSFSQDGDLPGVFGQLIDLPGNEIGPEFEVSLTTTGYQDQPTVASNNDGEFLVAWREDQSKRDCGERIVVRLFPTDGGVATDETLASDEATGCHAAPAVAVYAGTDFVVVWSAEKDGDETEIFGRRFPGGSPARDEFHVNTTTTGFQEFPDVAPIGNDGFIVVWGGRPASADADVFGQRYDVTGATVGSEFRVNTFTTAAQVTPKVASLANGESVIVWRSNGQDGSSWGVFGQLFNASGDPAGTEFRVNAFTTGGQGNDGGGGNRGMDVAPTPGGGFVVTWSSFDQDESHFAQVARSFDSSGAPTSSELVVNDETENSQRRGAIAGNGSGGFVVVWDSFLQDDSYHAVYGRRLTTTPGVSTTTTTNGNATTTSSSLTSTSGEPATTTSTVLPGGPLCGDGNQDDRLSSSDALLALRASVGTSECLECLCDVDSSGDITASDALAILRAAVGVPTSLTCAMCTGRPPTTSTTTLPAGA